LKEFILKADEEEKEDKTETLEAESCLSKPVVVKKKTQTERNKEHAKMLKVPNYYLVLCSFRLRFSS
jgi:hypothetical protein